ncbi:SRPBCC family protein [Streptomyces anulatus]
MSKIEESIEVAVPVRTAYDQWTQFEEFPRFMDRHQENARNAHNAHSAHEQNHRPGALNDRFEDRDTLHVMHHQKQVILESRRGRTWPTRGASSPDSGLQAFVDAAYGAWLSGLTSSARARSRSWR